VGTVLFAYRNVLEHVVEVQGFPANVLQRTAEELNPWIMAFGTATRRRTSYLLVRGRIDTVERTFVSEPCCLTITRRDEQAASHAVRRAIRQGLTYSLEGKQRWVQVHASAVALPGGAVILFVGESGCGKTSSALALCRQIPGAALVANDRVLMTPEQNSIIGWPTAIGVGKETLHRLGLPLQGFEWEDKVWFWPSELRSLGIATRAGGTVRLVIAPVFTLRESQDLIITGTSLALTDHVRLDALKEDNWWGIPRPKPREYANRLRRAGWLRSVPCFQITTPGLCGKYVGTLVQVVHQYAMERDAAWPRQGT